MKRKSVHMLFLIILVVIVFMNTGCDQKKQADIWTLPSLPRPIACEKVLITSAGQSTDAYIVAEIANELMIHNFFMPQAQETDSEDINSLVVTVGYSPTCMKSRGISFDEEKKRLTKLLDKAKIENLTIIVIFAGGKNRRGPKPDELLELVSARGDYMIGLQEANYDDFLVNLAKKHTLKLTLVKDVDDIREPFASAFR